MSIDEITKVLDSLKIGEDPQNVHNQIIEKCKEAINIAAEKENFGWIRIEPDGSNLPNNSVNQRAKKIYYEVFLENRGRAYNEPVSIWSLHSLRQQGEATHYKPIEKSKPPIV